MGGQVPPVGGQGSKGIKVMGFLGLLLFRDDVKTYATSKFAILKSQFLTLTWRS